jgi:HEAT repeat protein
MIKKISIAVLFLTLAVGYAHAGLNYKKLAQQLESGDVAVRQEAAKQLRGAKKNKKLDPVILQACRDKDEDVRIYGYFAIGKIDTRHDPEAVVQVLIDGLADPSVHVRRATVSSMGYINPFPNSCLPYMVRLLVDPDETTRNMIKTVFADIQGLGTGALMRQIDSKDADLRLAIVNTLGAMGPQAKSTLPRLRKIAGEDEDLRVKEAAERAIKSIER